MNKGMVLFSILLLLLILMFGCLGPLSGDSSAGAIISPSVTKLPFSGKWGVVEELVLEGSNGEALSNYIGAKLQFGENFLVFDDGKWGNVTYKIKKVDIFDYLSTKNMAPGRLSTMNTGCDNEVITAYSSGKYLGEFMGMGESEMIFFLHDKALLINKISDHVDALLSSGESRPAITEDSNGRQSCVLLGLKVEEEGAEIYKTLFIAYEQDLLHPILISDNIFFPRTSGFWELTVKDLWQSGRKANILEAKNVSINIADMEDKIEIQEELRGKSVRFIGNDYISIEKEEGKSKVLQVLPVDNLGSKSGIKISDLVDEKAYKLFLDTRENVVKNINTVGKTMDEDDDFLENFGIKRKEGHWVLQGRINHIEGDKVENLDFNLNTSLPEKLVFYDSLVLNWYKIRDAVPDAVDGFTSPNKDIAIVVTKNKMQIFKMETGQLSLKPLSEVVLTEGTEIIMAEWAVNAYVESWEQGFLSYGAQPINKGL